jgi:hypothetical protein
MRAEFAYTAQEVITGGDAGTTFLPRLYSTFMASVETTEDGRKTMAQIEARLMA